MHKHISYILLIIIFLQLTSLCNLNAQVKVQVVSKKFNQSINWKQGMSLHINGERADIFCTTHSSPTIEFEVTFIAKHESRNIAEADIKKMKWVSEDLKNKVFLRNYVELDKSQSKPDSDIKAIYHLKVPEGCYININNYFGEIKVDNVNCMLNINSEFSKIILNNIGGEAKLQSTFGDIYAKGMYGDFHIETNRSDIDLSNINGYLDIKSILAVITLTNINEIRGITIDAQKSKIYFISNDLSKFSLNLDLTNCELNIPKNQHLEFYKNEKNKILASFNKQDDYPSIEIKLTVGSLNIEQF